MKGEFKQILLEVFDILGFSDTEKAQALDSFKKRIASGILNSLKSELPEEQQEWINSQSDNSELNQDEPQIMEIQQTIKGLYSEDELYQKSRSVFKKILSDYINFMSPTLDSDAVSKLNDLLGRI